MISNAVKREKSIKQIKFCVLSPQKVQSSIIQFKIFKNKGVGGGGGGEYFIVASPI